MQQQLSVILNHRFIKPNKIPILKTLILLSHGTGVTVINGELHHQATTEFDGAFVIIDNSLHIFN